MSNLAWNLSLDSHIYNGILLYLNLPNSVIMVFMSFLLGKISIVYHPVLIYNDIPYWNTSIYWLFSPIIVNGYLFINSCWFSFQKYIINTKVPYFLGMTNMGALYWNLYTGVRTPLLDRQCKTLQKVSLFILGTE